ncbi:hypothetical protein SAMN04488056_11519 [Cohaesibacter marisflavi]|uniref:Apea-like HEPN domain-containing protein n=1 Tax=Cohaesibacter marisflavi TaxID=655353 RepID=A0A1I5KU58_9HYPH|nr:hypothetical protein [Cohaesibacter marisflavi]SFO88564.1 hypothetical protein SAMN04488056_11519 [Cohaesibacter marisflavi]
MSEFAELSYCVAIEILSSFYFEGGPERRIVKIKNEDVPQSVELLYQDTLFLSDVDLFQAALKFRKFGPKAWISLPISKVQNLLFSVFENYYFNICKEIRLCKKNCLIDVVSDDVIKKFGKFLLNSELFSPLVNEFYFPLTILQVCREMKFSKFEIMEGQKIFELLETEFVSKYFPKDKISSWILVKSYNYSEANKIKRIILGAIALSMPRLQRTQTNLRKVISGHIEIVVEPTLYTGECHTPQVSDILLKDSDQSWLEELNRLLVSNSKIDKRKRKSLEYYCRSWSMDDVTRCSFLFMALDALYGQGVSSNKEAFVSGVQSVAPKEIPEQRLKDIWDLRSQFLHGGAPDVFSATKYYDYCKRYKVDALLDVELIAEKCLRKDIFDGYEIEREDQFSTIFDEMRSQGIVPEVDPYRTIFD